MDKTVKMNLIEIVLRSCMFSEYLPREFSTEKLSKSDLDIRNGNSATPIPPVIFSMDKFNDLNNRRFIAIPEVSAFIAAVNSLAEGDILEKLTELNNSDEHSLSKFLIKEYELRRFSDSYELTMLTKAKIASEDNDSDFLENLRVKIEKSKACKCILHLDIANFFSSIYTHNITALTKGESWANDEYRKDLTGKKGERPSDEYIRLKNLDSSVAEMNCKRTHGLLMGPGLSFIIAESLLTRIDSELHQDLSKEGIDFVRYVDDYDVFIKYDPQIKIAKDVFNDVLQRYGLLINDSKTKIEEFPFYTYVDFGAESGAETDLCNLYAKFGQIEKNKTQNGAMLYFCKNVLPRYINSETALSLTFSILKNVSKALISGCQNIASYPVTKDNRPVIKKLMLECIKDFSRNRFDLESIWMLYTYLKLFPESALDAELLCEQHEVAFVIYLYESKYEKRVEQVIHFAPQCGWLLNYELFFNNHISETTLKENLKISDASALKVLKDRNINFYLKRE